MSRKPSALAGLLCLFAFFVSVPGPAAEEKADAWGMVPLSVPFYTPETGFGLGAAVIFYSKYNGDPSLTDTLSVAGMASLKNQYSLSLAGEKYLAEGDYKLAAQGSANFMKAEYFGIGPDAGDDGEDYDDRSLLACFSYLRRISKGFYLGPAVDAAFFSVRGRDSKGKLSGGGIDGSDGTNAVGLGIHAELNNLDSPFYPREGSSLETKAFFYSKNFGCEYDFRQIQIEYKRFFRITGDHVFGIDGIAGLSFGDVPFQKLFELGGQNMMRGYLQGQYRDKVYLAGQAEYRFPIVNRLGGTVFGSLGEVQEALDAVNADDLLLSWGLGLRVVLDKKEHIAFRFDIAFDHASRPSFYFNLLEAF